MIAYIKREMNANNTKKVKVLFNKLIKILLLKENREFIKSLKLERKGMTVNSLKLFEEIISNHSNEGDVVLDMFLGSGTTLIAANNLKRSCFGCEKDINYYTQTLERINKHLESKL